ncbi:MAG TPA: tetratricopeptide repeat protein [Planctomycetota bacterium]|nr:tetratricopeptide repeat protein [Planctomycetota bacterium]
MLALALAFLPMIAATPAQSDYESLLKDGNVYYDRQEFDKALDAYQKALKAKPTSAEAQALVGSSLSQLKRWDESFAAFEQALKLDAPRSAISVYTYKEMGLSYGKLGKMEDSIRAFQEGLKLSPKDDALLRNLGVSYARANRHEDALKVWEESLKVNANQPKVREMMAESRRALDERKRNPEPAGAGTTQAAKESPGMASFVLNAIAGWAFSADNITLVVSIPSQGQLAYFDTLKDEELKRVTVDFRPGHLAVQGESLFATGVGSSIVYVLDLASGKVKKELKVPGEPLNQLACHPSKGLLYASNTKGEVVAIDPSSGTTTKTKAMGGFLAMDAVSGAYLYSGRTSPNDFGVEVEKNPDGTTTWYFDDWGYRSMIRKYAVNGKDLKQVAINDNTACNGRAMHLSPDGKKVMMVGGGGWRGKRGGGGGYVIAVYGSDDLATTLGQIDLGPYPENIAFHPVLNVGVALKSEAELNFFNAKSFVTFRKTQVKGAPRGFNEPGWLTFGGRGSKVVYWQMGETFQQKPGTLYFIPLDLTSDDRAALEKAYKGGPKAPAAGPAKDSAAAFRDAEAAEKAGDLEKAAALYRQVAENDAGSDLGNRASRKALELDERKGDTGKAKQLLTTALQMEKNGSDSLALRYYKRIVDEYPKSPEAEEARKKIKELEKK